jgi:shikimate kinase
MVVLICGFMGCGKSWFTRRLKESSPSCHLLDLDDYILEKEGNGTEKLGQLIERKGWEFFREVEKGHLLDLMDQKTEGDLVLSLGGGTLRPETLGEIKTRRQVRLVWLNTSFETCYSRIKDDDNRPLVKKGVESLRELYQQRIPYYQQANLILDEKNQEQIKNIVQLHDRL